MLFRSLKHNADLTVHREPARFSRELYTLYAAYINDRHGDGDMYPPSEEQFTNFLTCEWADTHFYGFREKGKLLAVAVTDQLNDGLSAVYTFFDPTLPERSLGVMALLWQIEQCQRLRLPYLYLGYWIRQCQKMSYKNQYQPLEILASGSWKEQSEPNDSGD